MPVLSIQSNSWVDAVGTNDATLSGSGHSIRQSAGANGATETFATLGGGTSAVFRTPSSLFSSNSWTFFFLTRYTGGSKRRIVNGAGMNFLSGHWGGNWGVAYHQGWMGGTGAYGPNSNDWLLVCDRPQEVWFQVSGQTRKQVTGGNNGAPTFLHINDPGQSSGGETSDWEMAEMAVFNTRLPDADCEQNMQHYQVKFGVAP